MTHRRDIEGLRALAVAAVLLFHFGVPGVEGGFVGVDVFFVISGFLITSLLVTEREETGRISFVGFYLRRLRRLIPISATVLVATAAAASVWLEPTRMSDLVTDIRAAALFSANIVFADRGSEYLTSTLPPSPLQHYWSLGVEEQFYAVWPLLLAAVCIGAVRIRGRIAVLLAVVGGASLAASILLTADDPSWSYFGPHTRAWELAAGAALALAVRHGSLPLPGPLRSALSWTGILLIAGSVVTFGNVTGFPGWIAVVPVLGAVLALSGGDDAPAGPARVLRLAPLQHLGARSYSLYLWHWPALVLAEARAGREPGVGDRLVVLGVVLVLTEVGHRLIENPARRSATVLGRPAGGFTVASALVAASLLSASVLAARSPDLDTGFTAGVPGPVATSAASTTPTTTPPGPVDTSDETAPDAVIDALGATVLPDDLRPGLRGARFDLPVIYDDACHRFESSAPKPGCIYGDPSSDFTVALWGDSHAAQWFSPLAAIARERGWRLLSATQGSCGYLDVVPYNLAKRSVSRNCVVWRENVRSLLRSEGVDAVLLGQFNGVREASTKERITPERWRELLPDLVGSLRTDGIEPILLVDTPNPRESVPECLARNLRDVGACVVPAADRWSTGIDAVVRESATNLSVGVVEPARWLCHDGSCPAVVGNILVYRDENHVSDTVMSWLRPLIERAIAPWLEHLRRIG